jgi:hypothetical protein
MADIEETKDTNDMSVKQFREERIKPLTEKFKQLMDLNTEVAKLPQSGHILYKDGRKVGRKDLNSLKSQYIKELEGLVKLYAEAKRKKKSGRVGGSNGFKLPRYISSELSQFFADASNNLGPAYLREETVSATGEKTVEFKQQPQSLKDSIALLTTNQITSAALLTPLFNIYAILNNMQYDPDHREFLRSTPLMKKYLGQIFPRITEKDQGELAERQAELQKLIAEGGSPKKIKALQAKISKSIIFSEDRFPYPRIQSIVALNMIPKTSLGEEHLGVLKNADVIAQLEREQKIVSDTLAYYRNKNADQKKANRQAKRSKKPQPAATA